jgi:hypothetical protein
VRLYKGYRAITQPFRHPGDGHEPSGKARNKRNIILEEIECSRIIMDIKDELTMIQWHVQDQENALQSFLRCMPFDSRPTLDTYHEYGDMVGKAVVLLLARIERLMKRADLVNTGVCLSAWGRTSFKSTC